MLDGQRRNCYNPPTRSRKETPPAQVNSRIQLLHHSVDMNSRNSNYRLMDRLKNHTHFEQEKCWVQEKGNKQKKSSFS